MADTGSHRVRMIDNVFIPVRDGTQLSARIWLGEADEPVPAIIEYIPYRKNDVKAVRDSMIHPFFAAHGYASVRVDLRGSGESEGILRDEYLEQELQDGEDVIAWVRSQQWCTGSIGMMGISWGGFNALQLAARKPEGLAAIIPISFADDRYADDVHYMGGCQLLENLSWSSVMFAEMTKPPDPRIVGERWMDMWKGRLDAVEPWLITWLSHQLRDDYWKHGSVSDDYTDIDIPVFAMSGFEDGYSNTVFRLLENISGPHKGWVGPWQHHYPHIADPGPRAGFLQEAVRFWDRRLKGIRNRVDDDAVLTVWHGDPVHPNELEDPRRGRWLAFREWPHPSIKTQTWNLDVYSLTPTPPEAPGPIAAAAQGEPTAAVEVATAPESGYGAGKWYGFVYPNDRPQDQRRDDGAALTIDSGPLSQTLDIIGRPVLELTFAADRPAAMVAVRLNDVHPDGAVDRLSYGLRNLTHDDSHETTTPLEPGRRYFVRVPLNYTARRLTPGHRLRVSISPSYFPLAWPSPEPVKLTVFPGRSRLLLPVFHGDIGPLETELAEDHVPDTIAVSHVADGSDSRRVIQDQRTGVTRLEVENDSGVRRFEDIDLELQRIRSEVYESSRSDYYATRAAVESHRIMRRQNWHIHTKTWTELTATATHYRIKASVVAHHNEEMIHQQIWDEHIPRNGV
ncbi:MAG: CocE/NonD family hydrolase [Spirochaetota bacterium]